MARASAALRDGERRGDWDAIEREALEILAGFHGTAAYRWLAGCEVLGRELPVLLPADGRIMRGVLDLLVRDGQALTIVDYKTDRVAKNDLAAKADEYRLQGEAYRDAVRTAGGRKDVRFRLVFLRTGEMREA